MKRNRKFGRKNSQGFTLVELTVAMFILAVGVLGGMLMIIMGMTRDNTNRMDTTATNAAQSVMEQIAAVPANQNTNVFVTDCVPTAHTVTTAGSPGGSGGLPSWTAASPARCSSQSTATPAAATTRFTAGTWSSPMPPPCTSVTRSAMLPPSPVSRS